MPAVSESVQVVLADVSATANDASVPRALAALHALGQQTRLSIFRLLVSAEPHGIAAGAIAEAIDAPQNTVSGHLAVLAQAHLVMASRNGRSVVYRADLKGMRWLLEYLAADCCNGDPSQCATAFSFICDGECLEKVSSQDSV